MALPTKVVASLSVFAAFFSIILAWLAVPNEQAFPLRYPNILFVWPTGDPVDVSPVRYDGIALPKLSTSMLPGVYQHNLFFYHDRVDKFEPLEQRQNLRAWECLMFCKPQLPYPSQLYLIHANPNPEVKKSVHQWWLVEMKELDKETPVVLARTKGRKDFSLDAPWVEPDQTRTKSQALRLMVFSIWDVLWPGQDAIKWVSWVAFIGFWVLIIHKWWQDDDDF